jgi:hypothetical protein
MVAKGRAEEYRAKMVGRDPGSHTTDADKGDSGTLSRKLTDFMEWRRESGSGFC